MNIEVEEKYNGMVIKIGGNIIGIPDGNEFNKIIESLILENKKNIVVDLGDTDYVNSTGLGIIVRGYNKVKSAGGKIKMASLNGKMKTLLEITKLNTIIDIYDSKDEALLSFGGNSEKDNLEELKT